MKDASLIAAVCAGKFTKIAVCLGRYLWKMWTFLTYTVLVSVLNDLCSCDVVWFSPADQRLSIVSDIIARMPRAYKGNLR